MYVPRKSEKYDELSKNKIPYRFNDSNRDCIAPLQSCFSLEIHSHIRINQSHWTISNTARPCLSEIILSTHCLYKNIQTKDTSSFVYTTHNTKYKNDDVKCWTVDNVEIVLLTIVIITASTPVSIPRLRQSVQTFFSFIICIRCILFELSLPLPPWLHRLFQTIFCCWISSIDVNVNNFYL